MFVLPDTSGFSCVFPMGQLRSATSSNQKKKAPGFPKNEAELERLQKEQEQSTLRLLDLEATFLDVSLDVPGS